MELPRGGEGWQRLRQGYLPPEFTAGESGGEGWGAVCHREDRLWGLGWLVAKGWEVQGPTPDVALPGDRAVL